MPQRIGPLPPMGDVSPATRMQLAQGFTKGGSRGSGMRRRRTRRRRGSARGSRRTKRAAGRRKGGKRRMTAKQRKYFGKRKRRR